MNKTRLKLDANYWDSIAENMRGYHLEQNISIYKRDEHIKIIKKWSAGLKGKRVLKTDLFEEAFGEVSFLPWVLGQGAIVIGMDISFKVAYNAFSQEHEFNPCLNSCVNSDIRNCSFKDGTFDLIISNSTIDNLSANDAPKSLAELKRILKPEGILVLTLDNANNPLYLLGYYIAKLFNTNKYYQDRCYSIKKARLLAEQNDFIVQDITAIVHIPTPFNKLALFLKKTNCVFMGNIIALMIDAFSRLGNIQTKFFTGWFIALKLVKNDK